MDLKSNNKDIGHSIRTWKAANLENNVIVFENEETFDRKCKVGDIVIIDGVYGTIFDLFTAPEGIQIILYSSLTILILVKYNIYDGIEIPIEGRQYIIMNQNTLVTNTGENIGDDIREVFCVNKNGYASISTSISRVYKINGSIDNIIDITPGFLTIKAGDWLKINNRYYLVIDALDYSEKIFIKDRVKHRLYYSSNENKYYIKKIEEENRYIYGYVTNTSIGLEEKYVFVNTSDIDIRGLKPGDTIVFASSDSTLGTNKLFVTSASSSSVTAICKDSFKTFSIENSTGYRNVIILY